MPGQETPDEVFKHIGIQVTVHIMSFMFSGFVCDLCNFIINFFSEKKNVALFLSCNSISLIHILINLHP